MGQLAPRRPPLRHAGISRQEDAGVNERSDVRIHDEDALAEIELTSDLMIAASEQDTALTQEQVDAILGLRPA
jgi:hypothetical protein